MSAQVFMNLRILLPFGVFSENTGVSRIIADTGSGSMGILPHRLDCVAALAPGIFVYEIGEEGEVYLAVDQGILIKTGRDVVVSVRNAVGGTDLERLTETVEEEFMVLNEHEQNVRSVISKMEGAFIRNIATFHHG